MRIYLLLFPSRPARRTSRHDTGAALLLPSHLSFPLLHPSLVTSVGTVIVVAPRITTVLVVVDLHI